MSSLIWKVRFRPAGIVIGMALSTALLLAFAAQTGLAQQGQDKANPYAKPEDETRPQPVPDFKLPKILPTVAVAHDRHEYNVQMVNAALLPARQARDLGPGLLVQAPPHQDG